MKKLLVLLVLAFPMLAQQPPQIRSANERIAAKDLDGAIAILEDFTTKQPNRGGALLLLGRTYAQKGDVAGALRTYEKAAKLPPFRGQASFEIAVIHAGKGETDQAFEMLRRVRASGSFDYDLFRTDARLEALRKDTRFASLLPKPADFEKPFVEKTRVIHEIRGDAKGSQFGWIARRIGDVDGDKVTDFVTSAPTYPVDGSPGGRVYVYSSRSGKLLWQRTGKAGETLGIGVEAAGDTNKDGIGDVVAAGPGSGYAYVFSGRDGATLLTLGDGDANAQFGQHASGAGDMNGDGHADVIVGAPGVNRAFVYSGKDGAVLLTLEGEGSFGSTVAGKAPYLLVGAPTAGPHGTGRVFAYRGLFAKPAFTFESDDTGAAFGARFLNVIGDRFYMTDFPNSAKGPSTGRAYVYSATDGKLLFTLTGDAPGDGFGIGAGDAGDVDRDGTEDLIVGAWQHSGAAQSGGKVYVYSGRTQKLLRTITCRTPGDTLGFDTTNVGDVDRDGVVDFLLTSAWSGVNGFQSGRVFVVSGK